MAKSNLVVRVLSSVVALPVVLGVLFFAPPVGWFALVLCAALLGAFELFSMSAKTDRASVALGIVLTGTVAASLYFGGADPRTLVTLVLGLPVIALLVPLFRFRSIESAGFELMTAAAGPLYVGGLLVTSALLRRDLGSDGAKWVCLSLSIAWFADTGAYFTGRALGKAKLYPAVSPGKTRAGLWGALAFAALAGCLASTTYLPALPLLPGILLGIVAGLLGQLGDLVESLLKRSTGVKDSGALIPGHGGILNRVDALLFVSPIVYLYTLWFSH
ncbi:MAG: phosphatidate cytidylyltransferase [Polyangiaceae bacterium]